MNDMEEIVTPIEEIKTKSNEVTEDIIEEVVPEVINDGCNDDNFGFNSFGFSTGENGFFRVFSFGGMNNSVKIKINGQEINLNNDVGQEDQTERKELEDNREMDEGKQSD